MILHIFGKIDPAMTESSKAELFKWINNIQQPLEKEWWDDEFNEDTYGLIVYRKDYYR